MRTLVDHIVPGDTSNPLSIEVFDQPGQGGANHLYKITGFDTKSNTSDPFVALYGKPSDHTTILFQNGPIKEFGVNGITQEVLLAIVIDRLRSFQAGPFACRANDKALAHCEEALAWLQLRTVDRLRRGVEGTNQK